MGLGSERSSGRRSSSAPMPTSARALFGNPRRTGREHMRTFDPGTRVRVMQEGWGVFQNLPATAARFSEQTGIEVEVTLTVIPEMWELMERSFSGEDPPFDLVGVDDLLLVQAARLGHVEPLDAFIAADAYALDDFTNQALAAVSDGRHILGLPDCDASDVLIFPPDPLQEHRVGLAA